VENGNLRSAERIALKGGFDAIPIVEHGAIRRFWSREERGPVRIVRHNLVFYDTPIENLLPRFKTDGVQFVYYRTEVVGLVDVSDLNKPLARMVWLHPILECEQKIVEQTVKRGHDDDEITRVLENEAKRALKKQRQALQQDLKLRLLSFVYFREVLRAGVGLGIISISKTEIEKLNDLRNRLAHPGRSLIEHKGQ